MATSKKVEAAPSNEMIVTTRTRVDNKSTEKIESKVTFVFDDETATRKFAIRGATIAWQQAQRDAGKIAVEDRVMLSELAKRTGGGGFKITPDSIVAKVRKMPESEYRDTLAKLGMAVADINKLSKKQYAAQ